MLVKLIHTSISAGWLILAIIILRIVCKSIPKSMRCALWGLAAVRLILPFSVQSPLSLIPSAETIPERVLSMEVSTIPRQQAVQDIVIHPALAGSVDTQIEAASHVWDFEAYGTAAWLIGMALIIAYALVSYLRLRRTVSASLRWKGNIWICDQIDSPFILGFIEPHIYLPSCMGSDVSIYVVAHEQAHLKRLDHWWKLLGFVLLAVYWFHPLIWAAYILLCRDIELACDEKVIRTMGVGEKKAYSEALLSCSAAASVISACPLSFGEVGVKARVKSVLRYKKPKFRAVLAAAAITLVLAVCFLTDPSESFAENAEPDPAPSSQATITPSAGLDEQETAAADEAEAADSGEDLPNLIFYDGALYFEAYSMYVYVQLNGARTLRPELQDLEQLGQLVPVADGSRLPSKELETNDQRLVGAAIMQGCSEPDGLSVEYETELLVYKRYDTGLEARRAAMLASEESFSSALLNSYIADGYTALPYEDYTAQYAVQLLSLPNLPEGYKNSGYVLVRPDPGMPDHVMIAQLWYNYDLQAEILLQQNDFYSTEPISFVYTNTDEMGIELAYNDWMSYRAVHIGSLDGKYYDLLLFTTQDLGEGYCQNVLVVAEP